MDLKHIFVNLPASNANKFIHFYAFNFYFYHSCGIILQLRGFRCTNFKGPVMSAYKAVLQVPTVRRFRARGGGQVRAL